MRKAQIRAPAAGYLELATGEIAKEPADEDSADLSDAFGEFLEHMVETPPESLPPIPNMPEIDEEKE